MRSLQLISVFIEANAELDYDSTSDRTPSQPDSPFLRCLSRRWDEAASFNSEAETPFANVQQSKQSNGHNKTTEPNTTQSKGKGLGEIKWQRVYGIFLFLAAPALAVGFGALTRLAV